MTEHFYLRSEDKGYLASSGEDGGPVNLLPWTEKTCRKEQLLLWRKDGEHLVDEKGFALSVSGGDDVLPGIKCSKTSLY